MRASGPALLALVVGAALAGSATVLAGPWLAVPIVLIVLACWGAVTVVRRASQPHPPVEAELEGGIEFTDRDRETLLPSATPEEKRETRRRTAERERRS